MFEAELDIERGSLPAFCPLLMRRGMGEANARPRSLTVAAMMKRDGRLRHLVRAQGDGADKLLSARSHPTYDVPLHRVSRLSYLGVRETPPCLIYETVCSASCFVLGEKASGQGTSLKVAGETISEIQNLVKTLGRRRVKAKLRKIFRVKGSESLTPRQEQALRSAYEEGFFEFPHKTSFRELSAMLVCSPATYSILLRKAEEKVVSEHFMIGFST